MNRSLYRALSLLSCLLLAMPLAAQSKKPSPAPTSPAPAANPPPSTQGPGLVPMDEKGMSDEQARSHFKVGQSLYQAGRFAEAGAEWEKAYALSNRSSLLYNVYVAYRDAGDWKNAARALELFLAKGEVSIEERPTLQARLDVMKREIAEREAAEAAAAQAAAAPPPEPAAEPAPEPKQESSIVPWIVGGTGAAMVIAGIATGVVTLTKKNEINDACEQNGVCPSDFDLEAKRDSAKTMALVTDVLLIGGGVAVATGVVLGFLLEGKPESKIESGNLDCNGRGCTATLYGHF
jgi:tetratricopeptide (TPR) repeat protein